MGTRTLKILLLLVKVIVCILCTALGALLGAIAGSFGIGWLFSFIDHVTGTGGGGLASIGGLIWVVTIPLGVLSGAASLAVLSWYLMNIRKYRKNRRSKSTAGSAIESKWN